MKKMSDYLDAYGAACGLTSDYQIAKDLGLTKQAVSRYRNDKGCFELDIAWRISDATGIDLAEIIAASEIFRAERAHDDARATLWRRRLQTVSASLCTAFIGVFLFLASPGPAHAGALPTLGAPLNPYTLCEVQNRECGPTQRPQISTCLVPPGQFCHRFVMQPPNA